MPTHARGPEHLPGLLHHGGGELPGPGRGAPGGGPDPDGMDQLLEADPSVGAVLHAGQYLLERLALCED